MVLLPQPPALNQYTNKKNFVRDFLRCPRECFNLCVFKSFFVLAHCVNSSNVSTYLIPLFPPSFTLRCCFATQCSSIEVSLFYTRQTKVATALAKAFQACLFFVSILKLNFSSVVSFLAYRLQYSFEHIQLCLLVKLFRFRFVANCSGEYL